MFRLLIDFYRRSRDQKHYYYYSRCLCVGSRKEKQKATPSTPRGLSSPNQKSKSAHVRLTDLESVRSSNAHQPAAPLERQGTRMILLEFQRKLQKEENIVFRATSTWRDSIILLHQVTAGFSHRTAPETTSMLEPNLTVLHPAVLSLLQEGLCAVDDDIKPV